MVTHLILFIYSEWHWVSCVRCFGGDWGERRPLRARVLCRLPLGSMLSSLASMEFAKVADPERGSPMAHKPDGYCCCSTKADRHYRWIRWLGPIGSLIKHGWDLLG